jgi:nicotinate-nucleotide adenylyltransferase
LDTLLLVLADSPPHKDPGSISSAYHRYTMAAIATVSFPRICVSAIELENQNKRYTFETVDTLRRTYGDEAAIFFIIGSDSFDDLHKWKEPERILDNCNIVVAARPGYEIAGEALASKALTASQIDDLRGASARKPLRIEPGRGRVYLTDLASVDVSSSGIRRRVGQGLSIEGLAPGAVIDYIGKYGLYKEPGGS